MRFRFSIPKSLVSEEKFTCTVNTNPKAFRREIWTLNISSRYAPFSDYSKCRVDISIGFGQHAICKPEVDVPSTCALVQGPESANCRGATITQYP